MKLLSKQELNRQTSAERKMEIDEGVKLAKKIDELRRVASEEEAKLSKFRLASLKLIRDDRDSLYHERRLLIEEVKALQQQKEGLQKLLNDIKNA